MKLNLALLQRVIGLLAVAIIVVQTSGCGSDADAAVLPKTAFWEAFHAGDYKRLPEVIAGLSASLLQNKKDPETSLLLAHAHFWKVGEVAREKIVPLTFVDDFILAKKYFDKALLLNPTDYRIHGWSSSTEFTLGLLLDVPEWVDKGYQDMLASINLDPDFNYFSAGFPTIVLPPNDTLFQQGVENMWLAMAQCVAGLNIDRMNPDISSNIDAIINQDITGTKRVCVNNAKVPHGMEGFYLSFGDMLVKNNQPAVAKVIYANAKLSPDYMQWQYQSVLDTRIATADDRALAYQSSDPTRYPPTVINEPYACVICHGI